MTVFSYSNKRSRSENFSLWRMMNESERLHQNCKLLSEEEAKELFNKYYPQNEEKKDSN